MPDKTASKRNPPWTTDELILALDLYLKNPLFPPNKDSKEIQELSDLLNRLGSKIPGSKNTTYRNANGVHMKLMSFRHLDPQFESRGKVGLQVRPFEMELTVRIELEVFAENFPVVVLETHVLPTRVDVEVIDLESRGRRLRDLVDAGICLF